MMSTQNINEAFREHMFAILLSQKRILQAKIKAQRGWAANQSLNIEASINEKLLEEIELQLQELQTPAPVEENKPEEFGISEEKVQELYNAVYTPIMDARIEIKKLLKTESKEAEREIDNILFQLSVRAPQAAIDYFKIKK